MKDMTVKSVVSFSLRLASSLCMSMTLLLLDSILGGAYIFKEIYVNFVRKDVPSAISGQFPAVSKLVRPCFTT